MKSLVGGRLRIMPAEASSRRPPGGPGAQDLEKEKNQQQQQQQPQDCHAILCTALRAMCSREGLRQVRQRLGAHLRGRPVGVEEVEEAGGAGLAHVHAHQRLRASAKEGAQEATSC